MDPENIDSALERFEELLTVPQLDMPAFLIIEGGTWRERAEIVQQFGENIPERLAIVDINLPETFEDETIDDDRRSLRLVQEAILEHINLDRPSVVFLWWYDLLLPLDDRLRSFFQEIATVRCWVLIADRKWLSETSSSQRGGQFRGYLRDDTLGEVIVVRPSGAMERRHRNRQAHKQPANEATARAPTASAEQRFGPTQVQIESALRAREGQAKFREALLQAFQNRCAVTGSTVTELLEAAHIEPYSEGQDHRLSNGLILRTDIHTLFDKGLLAINPLEACRGQVVIHRYLQRDPHYKDLHSIFIALPAGECESRRIALLRHYDQFRTRGE